MKFDLRQKMGKGLAMEVAKAISATPELKEDFFIQLDNMWLDKLSKSKGAIDKDKEVEGMKKRLEKSGYWKVFESASITEEDLIDSLNRVIEKIGRGELGKTEHQPHWATLKTGRNEPCHCGSGKKYKRCCLREDEQ